jgi:hypothetical protein
MIRDAIDHRVWFYWRGAGPVTAAAVCAWEWVASCRWALRGGSQQAGGRIHGSAAKKLQSKARGRGRQEGTKRIGMASTRESYT